jgi:acetate kinase
MIVLVVNAGSSSLKYQLFDTNKNYEVLAKGLCDCIGLTEGGKIKHKVAGKVCLVMQLPEKMRENMLPFLNKLVAREAFKE